MISERLPHFAFGIQIVRDPSMKLVAIFVAQRGQRAKVRIKLDRTQRDRAGGKQEDPDTRTHCL